MKVIAFYLPQYHRISENDKWWGKGFTDWVNVKKARPNYNGHNQPRVPLEKNYYNLLEEKTQIWQSQIAQENGIYGFCYYHYWFNNKQLLEQPLNNMLKNKDITIPFCISWANEPWSRTWDGSQNEMLMPQEYGSEKNWLEHFEYLRKVFSDERYIKVENKPIFLVYRTENIPNCNEMFDLWNKEIKKFGFDGIHFIEMMTGFQNTSFYESSEGVMEFEPNYTMRYDVTFFHRMIRKIKKIIRNSCLIDQEKCPKFLLDIYDYSTIWSKITKRKSNYGNRKIYPGGFVGWDNSPRKGINSMIYKNESSEVFGEGMKSQIKKAKEFYNSEFVFINAWNEWAEGTYLEPDEKNGYSYLYTLKKIMKMNNK